MSCAGAPSKVRSLEQRIRNLEGSDGLALRRRVGMALVVVGQMLPEGAIKAGFTGRLVPRRTSHPRAVPATYVMQRSEVKLEYRGRPWCTVKFELGHNEIGDVDAFRTAGAEGHERWVES